MSRPRWVAFVAVVGAFMLAAAGCANDDSGGGGGAQSADCSADQFGSTTWTGSLTASPASLWGTTSSW